MWLISAIIASIVWGLNYALDERLFRDISPFTLLACQAWFAAIVFSLLSYFFTAKADFAVLASNKMALWILLASVVAANVGLYFIALSIQARNATLASLIEQSYPLFTILFTYVLFKQNYLTKNVLIGGVLVLIGVIVMAVE